MIEIIVYRLAHRHLPHHSESATVLEVLWGVLMFATAGGICIEIARQL